MQERKEAETKEKEEEEEEEEMAVAAANDDQRQGACQKRYVDYAIICASSPANLLSLLLVFAGKKEGQE